MSRPSTRNTPNPQVKVRVNFGNDVFVIIVPYSITYAMLMERITHKVALCGGVEPGPLRIKYEDEEGDYISIFTDDDVQIAFDSFCEQGGRAGETIGVVTLTVAN
jgi:cell division control protein 24